MGLTVAVLAGFALAAMAPAVQRWIPRASGWLWALWPLGLTIYLARFAGTIDERAPIQASSPWVPSLGLDFSLYLDGLSLLFALLVTAVGTLIFVYTGSYLRGHPQQGRLYALLLMFMSSMLGLVTAGNLLLLSVFWELTSISSYLLIGFEHGKRASRTAARQALLVTSAGGLALLAGLLLLGQEGGSLEVSELLGRGSEVRSSGLYLPILGLVLAGVLTKSAQFPFHFWLPQAMEAPTPVSAYLHSAAMVKAGIYLLARLSPVLGGTPQWEWLLLGFGTVTLLVGSTLALLVSDLKEILAYSTVSALGLMVLLLGLGTTTAVEAALVFLMAHAVYKAALFLVAGSVDQLTGTRDVDRLSGLWSAMPLTATAAALAGLSLSGVGPVLSFIGKELSFEAAWHADRRVWLAGATVLAGASFVAVAGIVTLRPFYGRRRETPKTPHRAPVAFWLGSVVMGVAGIALGLFSQLIEPLITAAVGAVRDQETSVHLQLWKGVNAPLLLSGLSLAIGIVIYWKRSSVRGLASRGAWPLHHGPAWWYELALRGLDGLAVGQTRILQSGYLRYYLLTILATTIGLGAITFAVRSEWEMSTDWSGLHPEEMVLALGIVLATVAVVAIRPRLAAIAALSLVGYGVTLGYAMFGAPDVAMTQFLVETLTFILFMLVYHRLPEDRPRSSRFSRARDGVVAASFGLLMSAFVLMALGSEDQASVSTYFAEHSQPDAHGRNVVNVILVDFRSLDTLGEITVLAVAGVGVFGLLKLRPDRPSGAPTTPETRARRSTEHASTQLEEAGDEPYR